MEFDRRLSQCRKTILAERTHAEQRTGCWLFVSRETCLVETAPTTSPILPKRPKLCLVCHLHPSCSVTDGMSRPCRAVNYWIAPHRSAGRNEAESRPFDENGQGVRSKRNSFGPKFQPLWRSHLFLKSNFLHLAPPEYLCSISYKSSSSSVFKRSHSCLGKAHHEDACN